MNFNENRYIELLTKLIGKSKFVQNRPPSLIPQESKIGNHVEAAMTPYLEKNGGPLKMNRIEFVPGRNNIIITYPGTGKKVISLVGSHMDVVPANPEEWSRDPFKLERDGDKLYGRGTTDCLGHVALITELFINLAVNKPALSASIVAVLIASEENSSIVGVGVDALMKNGYLENLKDGWVFWIDSADKNPCVGTAGMLAWKLTAKGRQGHSGMPHVAINSLMLAYESVMELMRRFHEKYPAHPKEKEYGFMSCSTMKPTMWDHPPGAINQIPGSATISGDVRLTPFYKAEEVRDQIIAWVKEINEKPTALNARGPNFAFETSEAKGSIAIEFESEIYHGIACNIESEGYKAISQATKEVVGTVKPYAVSGSLPLVHELQQAGYDLQISGYGLSKVYHGVNEYCEVSGMKQGFDILSKLITLLNDKSK